MYSSIIFSNTPTQWPLKHLKHTNKKPRHDVLMWIMCFDANLCWSTEESLYREQPVWISYNSWLIFLNKHTHLIHMITFVSSHVNLQFQPKLYIYMWLYTLVNICLSAEIWRLKTWMKYKKLEVQSAERRGYWWTLKEWLYLLKLSGGNSNSQFAWIGTDLIIRSHQLRF